MRYQVKRKSVYFESGYRVKFGWPVREVVDCDPILVVRVESAPGHTFNENVFGVKDQSGIVWTVGRRTHVYEDSPYTGLRKSNGNIKLFNWDGEELTLDPLNGKVLDVGYGK